MTHQLTTPTGKHLLLVDIPEDAADFWIHLNTVCCKVTLGFKEIYHAGEIFTDQQARESLEVTGKIIGKLSEISDFDEYVPKEKYGNRKSFVDYGWIANQRKPYFHLSSKDSFLSLLRSQGYVLEEPEKPRIPDSDSPMDIPEQNEYDYKYRIYQQQLSKYINPKTTLVIEVKS